jgi:hypothetical protein
MSDQAAKPRKCRGRGRQKAPIPDRDMVSRGVFTDVYWACERWLRARGLATDEFNPGRFPTR